MNRILLRGVRQHNLKNFDLEIPRDQLTVVTGVSGSGKSSLVFDTLYAEGQRRYVESVSTYARQFLDRLPRPDVDFLEGLSPAVAIRQSNPARSPRSTVGTSTELLDYLRLLFARIGVPHCEKCGREVRADGPGVVADRWIKAHPGELLHVLFPRPIASRKALQLEVERLVAAGFVRIFRDGDSAAIDPPPRLSPAEGERLWVVADRVSAEEGERTRLAESLASAFRQGEGRAALALRGGAPQPVHEAAWCSHCDLPAAESSPQLFSFNSPVGACPDCRGFGNILEFAEDLIIPDPALSLDEGALDPWAGSWRGHYDQTWRGKLRALKVRTSVPWEELTSRERDAALRGDGDRFGGVMGFLKKLQAKSYKAGNRFLVKRYQRAEACRACLGTRLRPVASTFKIDGTTLPELCQLTVAGAAGRIQSMQLSPRDAAISSQVLAELIARLEYLCEVGLGYLTLDRETRTLSGGETQRIELSNALGASLTETLYILDEPTVGLHPRDTRRLLGVLGRIRDRGNTLVVVEHDREVMEAADWMVDLGPGAGEQGGHVLFSGSFEGLLASDRSVTGSYLSGQTPVRPERARRPRTKAALKLEGIKLHNLDGLSVEIPLGLLVVVSGVSGSGKSTLVTEVLHPAVLAELGLAEGAERHDRRMTGSAPLRAAALLDQSPIGKSSRSNPATYLKAWDPVRDLYAQQPLSRERGYKSGHFSFNVSGGRCDKCEGEGRVKVEMFIMADVYLPCDACGGTRFKPEMLEVRYKGRSVADVMAMTGDEALGFFAGQTPVLARLHDLRRVGLGYLRLGQPSPMLSGGEAQRLKIARELSAGSDEPTLYLMDEPTTGLHPADVKVLLGVLDQLVDRGHSVVVIEHQVDVVAHADWVIDMGPEGGAGGGRIVAQGPPELVADSRDSHTAPFLRKVLFPDGTARRARFQVKKS